MVPFENVDRPLKALLNVVEILRLSLAALRAWDIMLNGVWLIVRHTAFHKERKRVYILA